MIYLAITKYATNVCMETGHTMKIKCSRCKGKGYETGIDDMGDLYYICDKCEGDIDSDREMQRERNFDRIQQSIEPDSGNTT